MASISAVAAALLAVAPAKFDPAGVIPDSANLVLYIPSPEKALERAEYLVKVAEMTSMVPDSTPGWMKRMLVGMNPDLADIDFKKPLWVGAIFPSDMKKGDTDAIEMVAAVGIKPGAKNAPSKLQQLTKQQNMKVKLQSGYIVARKGAVAKKSFSLPKTAGDLVKRSQVMVFMNLQDFPIDLLADSKQEAENMRELLPMLGKFTMGLGVSNTGIDLLGHGVPQPGSPYAKLLKGTPNTTKPLIKGLPKANYGLLFGSISSGSFEPAMFDYYRMMLEGAAKEEGMPQVVSFFDTVMSKAATNPGTCTEASLGIAVPSGPESIYFVGSEKCKKPAEAASFLPFIAQEVNKLIASVGKEVPVKATLGPVGQAKKAGGVRFQPLGLRFADANPDVPPLAKVPMYTATTKRSILMSWNAPTPTMAEHVKASKAGRPTPTKVFAATSKALISPRMTEMHIRVGALAAPFLTGQMAPMKFFINAIPPIGGAARTYKDGSYLTQIWLPKELAQMIGPIAQMAGLGSGLGMPKKSAPPSGGEDKGI